MTSVVNLKEINDKLDAKAKLPLDKRIASLEVEVAAIDGAIIATFEKIGEDYDSLIKRVTKLEQGLVSLPYSDEDLGV